MVSPAVSKTLRWMAGIEEPEEQAAPQPAFAAPFQDEPPPAPHSTRYAPSGQAPPPARDDYRLPEPTTAPALPPEPASAPEQPASSDQSWIGRAIQGLPTLSDIGSGIGSAAQTVQDAYAVPTEQRPPQYSGPSYAQPRLPEGQRPYVAPTETESAAVSTGFQHAAEAEPVERVPIPFTGASLPIPGPLQSPAGAVAGGLEALGAADQAVRARIDPRVWGFAKDGIRRELFTPEELAREAQLRGAMDPETGARYTALTPAEQDELAAMDQAVEQRYQQIKDDPNALTRYANASPAYGPTSAITDIALTPALGAAAGGAATRGAQAAGASARTARGIGYAADIAAQTVVDPTTPLTQGPVDAALAGLRTAGRAARVGADRFGSVFGGAGPSPAAAEALAAPGVQRLGSGVVPAGGETWDDISRRLAQASEEAAARAEAARAPRAPNDQLIREQFGRPWQEVAPTGPSAISTLGEATDQLVTEGRNLRTPRGQVRPSEVEEIGGPVRIEPQSINLNAGVGPAPRIGANRFGAVRADAFNAAQGGFMGGASEVLQAQEEGRDTDPAKMARSALIGGGLAVAGGRYARPAASAGQRLGSGVVPNIKATPAHVQAEAAKGARRGAMLNRAVALPSSEVPLGVRIAVEATDDRAGVRWAEDMMTDAAGRPRMGENDPRRASTLSRENAASIGNERVRSELEPAVIAAGKAGLHDELPQHLEDVQQRDILAAFYRRGQQEAVDAGVTDPALLDEAGMRAMRTREGRSNDMTWEAIDARLTAQEQRLKASGQWDQLQDAAEQVWAHNAQTRRRAHAAGEISAEDLAYYEETYPHYVPTVPLSHLDARGGPQASAGARVNRGTAPLVRALEDVGTSGERLNPIAASRSATLRAERSMQRNHTARAFVELYDEALQAAPGDLVAPSGKKSLLEGDTEFSYIENGEPVTIRVPKIVADGLEAAAASGADPGLMGRAQRSVMSTVTSSMTAGRASFLPVNVMRDMQDYAVRTATLEAAGGGGRMAGAAGGAANVPGIMGTWLDEAGKAASDIALAQFNPRGAVGAATGFAAGAAAGDEDTTVAERLRHGAAGAVAGTFLLGANKVRPTGKASEFLLRGGGSGGADTGWRASERWLRDVQRQGGRPIRSVGDAARYLGDWASDIASLQGVKGINERAELIARTAAMRRAEDVRGLAPTEATMAGRDITYDPDRAGRVARAVNGVVPFFNATTQSGAQFVRMFRQHPAAATATIVTTVGPVVAAAEAWNRSDPDRARVYDDVPDYVKNTGIVVVTPWAGSDSRGERPNYLWIPTGIITPFVLTMRESMRNVPGLEPRAEGTTPESDAARWGGMLNDVLQVFNPVRGDTAGSLASNLVPPVVKQAVELSNNRDLYRGMPIMSEPADERASAASKAIAGGARAVGRAVGSDFLQEVRPSGVEHLVRSLPAYGDIVTGASDLVAPSGYKQAEDRPVANEPFVGGVGARFIRDTGGQNLQDAEADRLGPTVRAVLEEAELPPSTIGTVSSRWQNGPLTRDEQLAWQEATNAEAERFVPQARRDARWRQPATRADAISDAMTKAREEGAKRARLPGSSEMERRMRAEEQMRAAG